MDHSSFPTPDEDFDLSNSNWENSFYDTTFEGPVPWEQAPVNPAGSGVNAQSTTAHSNQNNVPAGSGNANNQQQPQAAKTPATVANKKRQFWHHFWRKW